MLILNGFKPDCQLTNLSQQQCSAGIIILLLLPRKGHHDLHSPLVHTLG